MTATDETLGLKDAVLAAGAVLWRRSEDRIEIMLVHRPRYDDWSFPKGKREAEEPLPVTAIREVEEETGIRVRLDQPLPTSVYLLPNGRTKIVQYWVARQLRRTARGPKNPREIDQTRWVALDDAHLTLTRRADLVQLDALRRMVREDTHDTFPVIVQRHCSALSRSKWGPDESTRPLTGKGRRQAAGLGGLLSAFAPDVAVTSPWKRCRATLAPFTKRAHVRPESVPALTETGAKSDARAVRTEVDALFAAGRRTVVCTHRPVLPIVVQTVRPRAAESVALEMPSEDPYLAAGEMLVLHTSRSGQIVALERHRPIVHKRKS